MFNNNKIFQITLATIVLSFAAFNNKFPLLSPSSAANIDRVLNETDGNAIYYFFVRHSSWGYSLWYTVFTQALILAVLLRLAFVQKIQAERYTMVYWGSALLITFFSLASFTVSTIDPAVFLVFGIISGGLLFSSHDLTRNEFVFLAGIFVISLWINQALLFSAVFAVLIYLIINFLYVKLDERQVIVAKKRILSIVILLAIGSLSIIINHQRKQEVNHRMQQTRIEYDLKKRSAKHGLLMDYLIRLASLDKINIERTEQQPEIIKVMEKNFNSELRECLLADQIYAKKNLSYLNSCQLLLVISSIFFVVFSRKKTQKDDAIFALFVLVMYFFVTLAGMMPGFANVRSGNLVWITIIPIYRKLCRSYF
jgi:hypothetical protein